MNALTLHGVGLARSGQWRLLDSLELVDRATREAGLAGMLHTPGCQALLGYADEELIETDGCRTTCAECGGHGEVLATGNSGRDRYATCPWCGGEGAVDPQEALEQSGGRFSLADVKCWRTLDSLRVGDVYGSAPHWIDVADATLFVAQYRAFLKALVPQLRDRVVAPIPAPEIEPA